MCRDSVIGYVPRGEVTSCSLQLRLVTAIAHVIACLCCHVATLNPETILAMLRRQWYAKAAHHRFYDRAAACPDAGWAVYNHRSPLLHACEDVERGCVARHGKAHIAFHIRFQLILIHYGHIGSKPDGHSLQDGHVIINAVWREPHITADSYYSLV